MSSLKTAERALGNWNLRQAAMLGKREGTTKWITVNIVDFFNKSITEFCPEESCLLMSACPTYEYNLAGDTNIKKPINYSAPIYID